MDCQIYGEWQGTSRQILWWGGSFLKLNFTKKRFSVHGRGNFFTSTVLFLLPSGPPSSSGTVPAKYVIVSPRGGVHWFWVSIFLSSSGLTSHVSVHMIMSDLVSLARFNLFYFFRPDNPPNVMLLFLPVFSYLQN